MKVPHWQSSHIDEGKLANYLLAFSHPVGSTKARFFEGIGFKIGDPDALRLALLLHLKENDVSSTTDTAFGTKYIVDGPLLAPNGDLPIVRAVWFIESGEQAPRLVTAYPLKGVAR